MPTYVDQCVKVALFTTHNNRGFVGQIKKKVVTGFGNLGNVSRQNPVVQENSLDFAQINIRTGIKLSLERPAGFVVGNQFIDGSLSGETLVRM